MAIVESFIVRINQHLKETLDSLNKKKKRSVQDTKLTKIPWGKNWYQFSVDLTNMLAFYLLIPEKFRKMTFEAINVIDLIIETPEKSLNYTRDGANSVYMMGPWILSNLFKNIPILNHKSYNYVKSICALPFVTKPFDRGLYKDGTFISHETIYGWGYLQNMTNDMTMYLYELDKSIQNPHKKWKKCASLLFHKSINRGPPGIISRNESFLSPIEPTAVNGIKVIPTVRFLRFNTDNCRLIVRGIQENLGFYESDKNNFKVSQLWVQSRVPFTTKSPKSISEFKHCYGLWSMESESHDFTQIKSKKTTTDIFYPEKGSKSFVLQAHNVGFLYQEYSIQEYGNYNVRECIQMNELENVVIVTLMLQNNNKHQSIIFRGKTEEIDPFDISIDLDEFVIVPGTSAILETIINMNNGKMKTNRLSSHESLINFPLKIYLEENMIDRNNIIIHSDGRVQYNGTNYLKATDCDLSDSERTNTKFNEKLNQYTYTVTL